LLQLLLWIAAIIAVCDDDHDTTNSGGGIQRGTGKGKIGIGVAGGDVNCNIAPSTLYVIVVVTIPHCCRPVP